MKIIKKSGILVDFNPNKITNRIRQQSYGLKVDFDRLSISIISQMANNITTRDLDILCVETASSNVSYHPDYSILASRIFITSLRKYTPDTFSKSIKKLNDSLSTLSELFVNFVEENKELLDSWVVQDRDYNHDIFGLKTLENAYLLKDLDKNIIERPQYMWMRVAIQVCNYNLNTIKATYDAMSCKYYTHATPTLFNSGMKMSQLSSCFLLANKGDSIDGLFDTMKDVAHISKLAGGIGLHVHDVRARDSIINGTNGKSDGLLPMMKTYNEISRWINQGGKRKGSFAIYLEPWHADIFDFLDLKKNTGKEEMRARDLFYALWVSDLFMKLVENDGDWYLFCPNEVLKATGKALQDVIDDDFEKLFYKCVELGIYRKKIKARELFEKILISQIETGTPYIGYKDKVNNASNQKNLGIIKSSNLCIEINEYSSFDEQAVCNLASLGLPSFVNIKTKTFNMIKFEEIVRLAVRNLDNVIDVNYYPTIETNNSNSRHRPVGLGVQGLADVFILLGLPFDCQEAKDLNKTIFEHLYYFALSESNKIAIEKGSYSSFKGSPSSKGILQFDMWGDVELDSDLNWSKLKYDIVNKGLRNSLLIALMPTASTGQILGFNECFEPFTSNMYTRRTLSGEFIVVNKYLIQDLEFRGLWNSKMRTMLMKDNGSLLNLPLPTEVKELYKTAYELSMRTIIDMAADRQRFVCQAQSMNLFVKDVTNAKLSSIHMYGFKKGLKTGMYYLRTKAAVDAIKFTLDQNVTPIAKDDFKAMIDASKNAEDEDCLMCGS